MRIYRMTATFGKLDHETLTLEPGLNVIHAPNEWGKSTWCAFLVAMLYGLDTRAKTTKTALADKERFAPWSGSPMAGRMDLCWNGRDITIERTTKGRIPLGKFRAYETDTGVEITELTAANCGQMILGVEQSVFRRSGFIRLSDLPVTADEDLRRRLNALVTTGDESGDAERLTQELRDLRNRCRYNRTGLIPQAEGERQELENKLRDLEEMQDHCRKLKQRLGEVNGWLRLLMNHRTALAWARAEEDAARVARARDSQSQALARLAELERNCHNQPTEEEARKKLRELEDFRGQWETLQMDQQRLPEVPQEPQWEAPFTGMTLEKAEDMLGTDLRRYELLQRAKSYLAFLLIAGAFLVLAAVAVAAKELLAAGIGAALGIGFGIPGFVIRKKGKAEALALAQKYGAENADLWTEKLDRCRKIRKEYELALVEHRMARGDLDQWAAAMEKWRQSLCAEQSPEKVQSVWQQVLRRWEEYRVAQQEAQRWEQHLQTLTAMAKTAPKPEMADDLTYSERETAQLIGDTQQEQQRLQNRLGQYQGRMDAMGDPAALEDRLQKVNARLKKLENTYDALTLALDTLQEARVELQRRFAPRIAQRAQELMGRMTKGRYDRLTLQEDFSLQAGAEREDVLQSALWRSDGTVDQLYLALRLAVAEELIPDAPLVLDDALVRFDDVRLKAAMEILKQQAETKQVILFTCQERESKHM